MSIDPVRPEKLLKTFSFFPGEAPAHLRNQVMEDLLLISEKALEKWPKSTGALYGSLSFNEGKWRCHNGTTTITSDYDIYIILGSFYEYVEAMHSKSKFKKELSGIINNPFGITFIWKLMIKFRLVSVQAKVIWGNIYLNEMFKKTPPFPRKNCIRIGYLSLITSLYSSNRREHLESAVIKALWSNMLLERSPSENWHDIFSLRHGLDYLKTATSIGDREKDIISSVLRKKLGLTDNQDIYPDIELFNVARSILDRVYSLSDVGFRLKDYIHYLVYKVRTGSARKLIINFTKKRLEMFKSIVSLVGSEFNVQDNDKLAELTNEAEAMLGYSGSRKAQNKKEMLNYCCSLMENLGNIYIHKTGTFR